VGKSIKNVQSIMVEPRAVALSQQAARPAGAASRAFSGLGSWPVETAVWAGRAGAVSSGTEGE